MAIPQALDQCDMRGDMDLRTRLARKVAIDSGKRLARAAQRVKFQNIVGARQEVESSPRGSRKQRWSTGLLSVGGPNFGRRRKGG